MLAVTSAAAPPTLSVGATDATIGGTIHATAELAESPGATGEISFQVFAPDDPSCAGPALTPEPTPATVTGEGEYSSGDFSPTEAGTYLWSAQYTGDSTTNPPSPNAPRSRPSPRPPRAWRAPASDAVVGGAIHDELTVTAGFSPTEEAFSVYAPDDAGARRRLKRNPSRSPAARQPPRISRLSRPVNSAGAQATREMPTTKRRRWPAPPRTRPRTSARPRQGSPESRPRQPRSAPRSRTPSRSPAAEPDRPAHLQGLRPSRRDLLQRRQIRRSGLRLRQRCLLARGLLAVGGESLPLDRELRGRRQQQSNQPGLQRREPDLGSRQSLARPRRCRDRHRHRRLLDHRHRHRLRRIQPDRPAHLQGLRPHRRDLFEPGEIRSDGLRCRRRRILAAGLLAFRGGALSLDRELRGRRQQQSRDARLQHRQPVLGRHRGDAGPERSRDRHRDGRLADHRHRHDHQRVQPDRSDRLQGVRPHRRELLGPREI